MYESKVIEGPVGSAEDIFDISSLLEESHWFAEGHFTNDVPGNYKYGQSGFPYARPEGVESAQNRSQSSMLHALPGPMNLSSSFSLNLPIVLSTRGSYSVNPLAV